jgi:hypothetical protein
MNKTKLTSPQRLLLREYDKDLRNSARMAAATGSQQDIAKSEHMQWRAGIGDYAGLPIPPNEYKELLNYCKKMAKDYPDGGEQAGPLPETIVYYEELEENWSNGFKTYEAHGDRFEKWLKTPRSKRVDSEGYAVRRPNWNSDDGRRKWRQGSHDAKVRFEQDRAAQTSWRRENWRKGNYAIYNPKLREKPLTSEQEKTIEMFWPKPWFIQDWVNKNQ